MIAMAITQIHTHWRNGHGSCRDGEGGALDASQPHTGYRCSLPRRQGWSETGALAASPDGERHARGTPTPPTPAAGHAAGGREARPHTPSSPLKSRQRRPHPSPAIKPLALHLARLVPWPSTPSINVLVKLKQQPAAQRRKRKLSNAQQASLTTLAYSHASSCRVKQPRSLLSGSAQNISAMTPGPEVSRAAPASLAPRQNAHNDSDRLGRLTQRTSDACQPTRIFRTATADPGRCHQVTAGL